jgi:hypothetical protein
MNQRGTSPAMRTQLLQEATAVIDPKRFDWKMHEPHLTHIWEKEHENLLTRLQEKFESYRDLWVKSPAGQHFAHMIADSQ